MPKPDLSEFEKLSNPKKARCKVGRALEALDGEEREKLEAALSADSGVITSGAIAQWCKARDLSASHSGVTSHRRGSCSCND